MGMVKIGVRFYCYIKHFNFNIKRYLTLIITNIETQAHTLKCKAVF